MDAIFIRNAVYAAAICGLGGLGSALSANPSNATVYYLTEAAPAAHLGAGPYGQIVTSVVDANTINITETLYGPYKFHQGNANHNDLVFETLGNLPVTISDLTAGFQQVGGPGQGAFDAPPFGNKIWDYAIACTTG